MPKISLYTMNRIMTEAASLARKFDLTPATIQQSKFLAVLLLENGHQDYDSLFIETGLKGKCLLEKSDGLDHLDALTSFECHHLITAQLKARQPELHSYDKENAGDSLPAK